MQEAAAYLSEEKISEHFSCQALANNDSNDTYIQFFVFVYKCERKL